ncbi:MAG: hypothetical protein MUP66_00180 [Candidatus Nanohaloarchaeota archaeon QJJ-5]|nr:hypothetical protein [Candidatus Nanohaloarchaeota archaeon QJJ-5]
MSEWTKLRYILAGSEPNIPLRLAAIVAVLADTVTTLYILYLSDLPVGEFNPLIYLTELGFIGDVLFISVPLFTVLAAFYLPGLFGDAVALTLLFINGLAAVVNFIHSQGLMVEAVIGIPVETVYLFIITFGTGVGVLVHLPALYHRDKQYDGEQE